MGAMVSLILPDTRVNGRSDAIVLQTLLMTGSVERFRRQGQHTPWAYGNQRRHS